MGTLHDLSAVELLAGYRSGALSPVEVTRDVIAHIRAWEPHLHATYAYEPDEALAQAEASQARWARGAPQGALDGVPVTIKENIATRGVPVPLGTAATELVPALQDAPPAARLREAGAVILGKTTMPDYGMLSSGLSSFHKLTRNPWDLTLGPGGSSAGAGAAAAAGYGPLHVGTDIGGSVRLPAGWCGIFALKPSLGRIPIHPPYAGRVAGPMTRSVADAALLMATLSLPDARDTMSLPYQAIDWQDLERDLRGLKVGLLMDAGWGLPLDPEVRASIEAAAALFAAEGAVVTPVAPFMTRAMIDGMDDFWRTRSWLDISALPPGRRDKVLPYILAWARGGEGLSGERVFRGYGMMGAMRDAAIAACAPFDVLLSPTAPIAAFPAHLAGPTNDPATPFEHIAYTLPYNMSEQPAASINCGHTAAGLPIGLQIVGQRHDDLRVLQVARAYERLRPAQRAWPTPPPGRSDTAMNDPRGNGVSTRSATAVAATERALWRIMSFYGTPIDDLAEARAADPDWPLPLLMQAGFLLSLTEPDLLEEARGLLDQVEPMIARANHRERDHLVALHTLLAGDWHGACREWEALLLHYPRDALALHWAHLFDFYRGDALNLRQRVARVLPEWDPHDPLHPYVLGQYAFGLEECQLYAEAEATGRRALAGAAKVPWAIHAVAHVMEMQGRHGEGAAWMRQWHGDWAEGNGFAGHLGWHQALFALEALDHAEALRLYDAHLRPEPSQITLQRLDAASLLWRLHLLGVDVGTRWSMLAAGWD